MFLRCFHLKFPKVLKYYGTTFCPKRDILQPNVTLTKRRISLFRQRQNTTPKRFNPPAHPLPAHPFTLTMRPDIYWSSRCNLLHAVSLLQPYKVFLRVRITSRQIRRQVFYKWHSSHKYLYLSQHRKKFVLQRKLLVYS